MIDIKTYRVELRATPDTPKIEADAAKQGRTLSPQTVYWAVCADSKEEAIKRAIAREYQFLYRKEVWSVGCEEMAND